MLDASLIAKMETEIANRENGVSKAFVVTHTAIQIGNRTVHITANDASGPFSSRLYVNTRNGDPGDATGTHAKHKSLAAAIEWANALLADPGSVTAGPRSRILKR
jgi:hypothetical protein